MKRKLFSVFAYIAAFAIVISSCAVRQNNEFGTNTPDNTQTESNTEAEHNTLSIDNESSNAADGYSSNDETNSPTQQTDKKQSSEENTVKKMNLQIGNSSFTATLESNAAVDALVNMMREAPIVIQMSDYSGFEKVGSLGTSLPADNKQTTTQSGDIVLYNGNQIVIFYGSNSWSYTRLGKIDDLSGWEEALGRGNVTVTFTFE